MLNLEEQIINQINKAKSILIVFDANWTGDALASSLALFWFLKKLEKEVEIAFYNKNNIDGQNDKTIWNFLPGYNQIKNNLSNLRKFIVSVNIKNASISQIKYNVEGEKLNFIIAPEKGWFEPSDVSSYSGGFKYDLIFCIDTPDLESLEQIYDNNVEFFYKTPIINIDHKANNEEYGQINYLDINLASNAEIIFNLINHYDKDLLNEDIATCLLAGIISKTKNYKNPNLTPRTLLTSSKLISAGARREEIVQHLYRSRPLSSLKVWGQILNKLETDTTHGLTWSILDLENKEFSDYQSLHLEELAEEIFNSSPTIRILLIIIKLSTASKIQVIAFANKGQSATLALKEFKLINSGKYESVAEISPIPANWKEEIINSVKKCLDKNIG